MSERLKWISPNNAAQIEWAERYLSAKKLHISQTWSTDGTPNTPHTNLVKWDQNQKETADHRELLRRMQAAWTQKKYRERTKGKRAYSIVLPVKTKQQLNRFAKELNSSLAETIEKLLPSSEEHRLEYLENERQACQKSKQAGTDPLKAVEDHRNNAKIFADLLALSLVDLSICTLRLNQFQQPHSGNSETDISEILQMSTDLLNGLLKGRDRGIERRQTSISHLTQAVFPDPTLIEQRLVHFAQKSDPAPTPNALTPETNPTPPLAPENDQVTLQPGRSPEKTDQGTSPIKKTISELADLARKST